MMRCMATMVTKILDKDDKELVVKVAKKRHAFHKANKTPHAYGKIGRS